MRKSILLVLAGLNLAACTQISELQLSPLISDGMIMQQKSEVAIWGHAVPGAHVDISTDWDFSVAATANSQGVWSAMITTLPADYKKHSMTIAASDTTIVVNDVLFGEVWLASGQSNMEMPLAGWGNDTVYNGRQTIAEAHDDFLRIFTVGRNATLSNQSDINGEWKPSTPENLANASATAYYFAQSLRSVIDVPVGVVVSCWGGTPIEAWIDMKTLAEEPSMDETINMLTRLSNDASEYEEWLMEHPSTKLTGVGIVDPYSNITVNDEEFAIDPTSDISSWETIELPGYMEEKTQMGDVDGVVWFAKDVVIPSSWVGHKLRLHLGAIDDRDITYVNGVEVGRMQSQNVYNVDRDYDVPAGLVTGNTLRVVVRLTDHGGNGGFAGCENGIRIEKVGVHKSFPIDGEWKYAVAAEFTNGLMYQFDVTKNEYARREMNSRRILESTPTALFNGMIKTIANFGYRGAIWYQGEANVGRAKTYYNLQKLLVESWRQAISPNLSFYCVQIAPYSYDNCDDDQSTYLREAQRRAAADTKNCEIISTLDIGSDATIHPGYKHEVGSRLAIRALKYDYGFDDVIDSGPEIEEMTFNKNIVTIRFRNGEGLYIDPNGDSEFELIDEFGNSYAATPYIDGDEIHLFSHSVPKPHDVRYTTRNCSKATLFNGIGLPAPAFNTGELK